MHPVVRAGSPGPGGAARERRPPGGGAAEGDAAEGGPPHGVFLPPFLPCRLAQPLRSFPGEAVAARPAAHVVRAEGCVPRPPVRAASPWAALGGGAFGGSGAEASGRPQWGRRPQRKARSAGASVTAPREGPARRRWPSASWGGSSPRTLLVGTLILAFPGRRPARSRCPVPARPVRGARCSRGPAYPRPAVCGGAGPLGPPPPPPRCGILSLGILACPAHRG